MKGEKEATGTHSEAANFERREYPRIALNLALEYWRVGESGTRAGCTGDISEGGSLLHLPEELEVGQELRLKLFVDPGFGFRSVEVRAEVIWKGRDNKQEKDYRIGVKFGEISPEDLRNLKSFLASLAHLRIPAEIPPKLLSDLGITLVMASKDSREC